MSNAHGWATGAAKALTSGVLGLRSASKDSWVVTPQPVEGVSFCEGALPMAYGRLQARWEATEDTLAVNITTPPVDLVNEVRLPLSSTSCVLLKIDGKTRFTSFNNATRQFNPDVMEVGQTGDALTIRSVPVGSHSFKLFEGQSCFNLMKTPLI